MKVLVTAASAHGSTSAIADAIGRKLESRGLNVDVLPPDRVHDIDRYGAVVLGSAVYAGRWLPSATKLVDRAAGSLAARPVWLFSSGPVGRPERKLVRLMGQDPVDLPGIRAATHARAHRMFPGKLDKRDVRRSQRFALKLFRGLEGDFRDWPAIEAWASGIADELRQPVDATRR